MSKKGTLSSCYRATSIMATFLLILPALISRDTKVIARSQASSIHEAERTKEIGSALTDKYYSSSMVPPSVVSWLIIKITVMAPWLNCK